MPKFITIEGAEGMGKSTVIATICETLHKAAIDYILTREPGGTKIGEDIRTVLLADCEETLMPLTEALLFFAGREQNITQLIKPALAKDKWVVSDRFTDSSLAYQGGGRGVSPDKLDALVNWVQGDCVPDMTLLLDAPIEVGLERIKKRGKDRIENESIEFFKRVRERYLELADANPQRYRIVNSNQPIADVQKDVAALITTCIESA
jgi:dTMP kinase